MVLTKQDTEANLQKSSQGSQELSTTQILKPEVVEITMTKMMLDR